MNVGSLSVAVCAIYVLTGCAVSQPQPVAYRASGNDHKLIEYKSGGYASRDRFIANGIYACYEEYRWKKGPSDGNGFDLDYQIQNVPSADAWKKFWRVVDGLELARWKPKYSESDIPPDSHGSRTYVVDAGDWSLTYLTARGKLESKGDGAGPAAGHPEHVLSPAAPHEEWQKNALRPLEAAFKELVGMPLNG